MEDNISKSSVFIAALFCIIAICIGLYLDVFAGIIALLYNVVICYAVSVFLRKRATLLRHLFYKSLAICVLTYIFANYIRLFLQGICPDQSDNYFMDNVVVSYLSIASLAFMILFIIIGIIYFLTEIKNDYTDQPKN